MFRKQSFILFFILTFSLNVNSQIDTSFWFVAPDISVGLGDRPIYMYINTYDQPSTIKLRQPANLGFVPITLSIPANSIDSINLTPFISSVENDVADVVLNRGLYLSASEKVSVLYSIRAGLNKEHISLKGPKGLGTDFYIPMQQFWDQEPITVPKSFSAFDIVATNPNTTVLITPRTNIINHTANVTFTVLLQAGETFSCRDTARSAATSLAGSIVSSDKPVGITIQSSGIAQSGCLSSVADQITNSTYIGTDYIIDKGVGANDKIFILATQNGTHLTIDDGSVTSPFLNFGQTHVYSALQPITYVKSDKPIYVLHVSANNCRLSGAQVPPFFCAGTYSASFTRSSSDSLALNITTRTGYESNFALNGNPLLIPSSSFTVVPGSSGNIKTAKIYFNTATIPVGSHNMVTNTKDVFSLGVINGSSLLGNAYSYVSEFSAYPFSNAGADFTICANGKISLNGLVGGGNVNGTWTTNGFGSFTSGFSVLTNTYVPSQLDTTIKPIKLALTSTGPCPVAKDTLYLTVKPSPLVNASVDQIVCANNSSVTLNGSVSGGASTGKWTTSGSGSFIPDDITLNAVYVPSALDKAAGTVKLILTSTAAGICANEKDSMYITITPAPVVDAGPPSYSVCANNPTLTVSGSVTGITTTGKWTTSGTGIFSPSNIIMTTGYFPTPGDIALGSIKLYLTSTNNLTCNQVKDSILLVFTPAPSVNAGVDLITCKNSPTAILSGTVSGPTSTGIWSGGLGTYSPSNAVLNPTYTPTSAEIAAGFVNLTLTSTFNLTCLANSDAVRIVFAPKPVANFNFFNVCLNNPNSFTDFSLPGSGTLDKWDWSFGAVGTSTLQNPIYTFPSSGTFTTQLIVRNSFGCFDTIKKTPVVYPLPNVNFGINRICTGAFLNLSFTDSTTITAPETITNWYWDFAGLFNSNLQNPIQLFPGDGLYNITLIATSNHGCKDTLTKQITLNPRPIAGFAYSISSGVNVASRVDFIETSKYASNWVWNFGDGSPTTTVRNPSNTYYSNGVYVVTQIAYDSYGCSDTARAAIKINNVTNEISTLIPNAISPNGDGKNDVWKLEFISILYPNAEIDIYNRWGENVFHSVGYSVPWDGSYKGQNLPVGTYYYVLNLHDSNIKEVFKGGILLIR